MKLIKTVPFDRYTTAVGMKSFRWAVVVLLVTVLIFWPSSNNKQTTVLLSTGIGMPRVGLGTWKSEKGVVGAAVKHAMQNGYRHIDMAPRYGNEKEIGKAFSDVFETRERGEFFLGSKLWNTDHHPSRVSVALTTTLSDLRISYLDVWYMHWPVSLQPGGDIFPEIKFEEVAIKDTWAAMEEEYDAGRVRSLAVSNFNVEQLSVLLKSARIKPVANQVELHPYLPNGRLVEYCRKNNIQVVAYSPIGSPGNAANNRKDVTALIKNNVITRLATEFSRTPAQIILKWALQKGVVVIPKSITPTRIDENFAAASLSDLPPRAISEIDRLPEIPVRYVSSPHLWNGATELEFWKDNGTERII